MRATVGPKRRMNKVLVAFVTVCAFGALGRSSGAAAGGVNAEINWTNHGGAPDESNYSPLEQINTKNVGRLGLAWSLELAGETSLEATPLAIDGVLYFTGSSADVYAVDAASGKILWKYDPEVWKYRQERLKTIWAINRGVAYSEGRVFVGTMDGRLIALDAHSGNPIWITKTVTDESMQTITGAPWVIKGKVLIGNGGADFAARGYVTAYDAASGRKLWRFYTVPGDPAKDYESEPFERDAMAMAAKTWSGEWWKIGGGGGTVWDNMTYDAELNRIYIGTGNAGPWNPRVRSPGGGDNLFLASVVAVDADTGKYIWHYQMNPSESWDYKCTANIILADLSIGGQIRKVLMQSPTNGFFYVIDRTDGKLISAEKTGKVTWAERIDIKTGRPIEATNVRYESGPTEIWPAAAGSHSWQGMSYDKRTGLVYIPYMQLGERIMDEKTPPAEKPDPPIHFGGVYIELFVRDADDDKGALLAWDPLGQNVRWKFPHDSLWNGGAMSTAGNLVFQGTGDGDFSAYDAANGNRIWSFDARQGIIASPISYTVNGVQYVSVLAGYGGAIAPMSNLANRGWKFRSPRRLLTFTLDAKSNIPNSPPRDLTVRALDDPALQIDPPQAKAGLAVYQGNCAYCHGRLLVSAGGPAPDLRESPIALHWASFRAVVKDGALLNKLMPRFQELSDDQLQEVYMYIRSGSRQVLQAQKLQK